jgi:NADH-quinone oxidoreductase subunit N
MLLVGVSFSKLNYRNQAILTNSIANIGIIALFFLIILYWNSIETNFITFNYLFFSNNVNVFFKALICMFTFIVISVSFSYLVEEKLYSFEYSVLILLAVLGMLLLISAYDFLAMYLALELQSLCLYILAAYKRKDVSSTEAGLKYFVLGAFSSGIMLFGLTLLYGITGTTSFEDFSNYVFYYNLGGLITDYDCLIGIVFIMAGLLFKLSAAPFHFWTPDVYDGAPLIVVTFFAVVAKIAAFGILILIIYKAFLPHFEFVSIILLICSFLSLIVGTFGALYQQKVKRLYAYSTINHVGFMLLGLSTVSVEGLEASLFYLIVYLILSLTLFLILLSIRKSVDNRKIVYLNQFSMLLRNNSILAFIFALNLFSIAGIPPLIGFYSKYYIMLAAFKSHYYFMAVIAIFLSVISAVYYIRLIVLMFFESYNDNLLFFKRVPSQLTLLTSYSVLVNSLFFVFPENIFLFCHNLAVHFFLI